MALPSDDDEFEGDAVAYAPVIGTQVPYPVITQARHHLAQMALVGGGEIHGAFYINYGRSIWTAIPRQDPFGGYKLLFIEKAGCEDKRPLIVSYEGDIAAPNFEAYFNDGVEEAWDNLDDPTGTRLKHRKLPKMLRTSNAWSGDGASYFPASMFTGQMREVVQCWFARERNHPFVSDRLTTHGIIEYPHPRVVGGTSAEEATNAGQRKFWLVEISANGVYATRVKNTRECCDSWTSALFGAPPSIEIPPPLSLHGKYLELEAEDPDQTRIRQLLPSGSMPNFATLFPATTWMGWAFSYSGHEAQHVYFNQQLTESAAVLFIAKRYKLAFSFSVVDDVVVPAAVITTEEDVTFNQWPTCTALIVPDTTSSDQLTYRRGVSGGSSRSGDGLGATPADVDFPIHVFYEGDTARVTRISAVYTSTFVPPTPLPAPFLTCDFGAIDQCPFVGGVGFLGTWTSADWESQNSGDVTVTVTCGALSLSETYYETINGFITFSAPIETQRTCTSMGTDCFQLDCAGCGGCVPCGGIFFYDRACAPWVTTETRPAVTRADFSDTSRATGYVVVRIPYLDREAIQATRVKFEHIVIVDTESTAIGCSCTEVHLEGTGTLEQVDNLCSPIGPTNFDFTVPGCTPAGPICDSDESFPSIDNSEESLNNDLSFFWKLRSASDTGSKTLTGVASGSVDPDEYLLVLPASDLSAAPQRIPVFLMGGGLFYADPSLTPPTAQYTNRVTLVTSATLDMTTLTTDNAFEAHSTTVGGFDTPFRGIPRSFVGRI